MYNYYAYQYTLLHIHVYSVVLKIEMDLQKKNIISILDIWLTTKSDA